MRVWSGMREIRRKPAAYEPKNDASVKFSASRALTAALLRCRADRRRTDFLIVMPSVPISGNAFGLRSIRMPKQ